MKSGYAWNNVKHIITVDTIMYGCAVHDKKRAAYEKNKYIPREAVVGHFIQ